MKKDKLIYLKPAIRTVAVLPPRLMSQSMIVHKMQVPEEDIDEDIELEDYREDERDGRYFTFDW